MLRRISVIAASAAMLAVSALPAYAAPQASTHKLSFPAVKGIAESGTYIKYGKYVQIHVCARSTSKSNFAVAAVVIATNSAGTRQGNLGAVAIGYGQTVCRSGRIPYTSHLKTYDFIANSHGYISYRSGYRKIY